MADHVAGSGADSRPRRHDLRIAQLGRLGSKWLSPIFWLSAAGFLALGVRLAAVNGSDGGWDSAANLVAARNIAEGRGFTTDMVQVHVVPQSLPGEETVRTPALPYMLGWLQRAFGASSALPVLLNVCIVLLAAITLRSAIAGIAPRWLANVMAILFLLGGNNFDLVRVLNNDLLVLVTVLALLVASRAQRGGGRGWALMVACAALTAMAFLTKQSYVVSLVPFTIVLIGALPNVSRRRRAALLVGAGSLSLALTAPYWAGSIARHGTPIYSPIQQLRLPARYGTEPLDMFQRTVHFGEAPPTYGSIVAELGMHQMLQRELDMLRMLEAALARRGMLVLGLVLVTLPFMQRSRWRLYTLATTLAVAPVFDAVWWLPEDRYLFPLFAVFLFLAALGTSDYLAGERRLLAPAMAIRCRVAFAAIVALLIGSGLLNSRWGWRSEFTAAQKPAPAWTTAVRRLPSDAVILTSDVPYVTWWTRRKSVVEPCGDRVQLEQVAALYAPDYYLDILPGPRRDRPLFAPGELTPVASEEAWALYRVAVNSRYQRSQVLAIKSERHSSRCPVAAN